MYNSTVLELYILHGDIGEDDVKVQHMSAAVS